MVIVVLTNSPPKLRGDLTKWLMEVNTGVYVGKINARVRKELWERICDNLGNGSATMVFPAKNEQGFDFYTYNSSWIPTDYEGIKLIVRPKINTLKHSTRSKATINQIISKKSRFQNNQQGYCVIDIETTGLSANKDEIMEIAAIRIINHTIAEKLNVLIQSTKPISQEIQKLTGITNDMVKSGVLEKEALTMLLEFIGDSPIMGYNISFDARFLNRNLSKNNLRLINNKLIDVRDLAEREINDINDYKLKTVAQYFNLPVTVFHRALDDCITTFKIYEKLHENG